MRRWQQAAKSAAASASSTSSSDQPPCEQQQQQQYQQQQDQKHQDQQQQDQKQDQAHQQHAKGKQGYPPWSTKVKAQAKAHLSNNKQQMTDRGQYSIDESGSKVFVASSEFGGGTYGVGMGRQRVRKRGSGCGGGSGGSGGSGGGGSGVNSDVSSALSTMQVMAGSTAKLVEALVSKTEPGVKDESDDTMTAKVEPEGWHHWQNDGGRWHNWGAKRNKWR
jgi:DNA mismatch repair ATPase MutL